MPDLWMDVDAALAEVPVNILPLLDDTDFKTREVAVAYNAAGMDLVWNFVTTGGTFTQTAVTPTTAGDYDWTHQGDGMYSIEIPASAGASINNDTEGVGWFTGLATGVLPWRGPTIGFRAAGLNEALIDSAWSATRGLAGTALPAAAADAAGGLPISDAGALDLDARLDAAITSRLAPTVAGRTLDVSAGGEAGVDWANVGSPTTAQGLSGTTISTSQAVASVSGAVGSVTGAVGSVTGAVGSVTADVGITQAGADKVWGSAARTLTSFGTLVADLAAAVWGAVTRTLTAGTNIALAKGIGVTGFNDLDAAGVRGAVGLASANLDTQLTAIDDYLDTEVAAIKAKTDNLPASPAAVGSAMTLTTGERDSIAAALLDLANGIETDLTLRQALKLIGAATAGVLSGAATAEITIKAARNTGTTRITATVDADGNRSAITYNL